MAKAELGFSEVVGLKAFEEFGRVVADSPDEFLGDFGDLAGNARRGSYVSCQHIIRYAEDDA